VFIYLTLSGTETARPRKTNRIVTSAKRNRQHQFESSRSEILSLLVEKSVPKGETSGRAFRNKEGNPHYPDKLDKALEMAHKAP
jgi:hypothetical protein